MSAMPARAMLWKAAAVLAATLIVGACGGSPQARSITLTFIRHGESEANAAGILNTDVPGPSLSPTGKDQAEQVAHDFARSGYDAIYASTMVRTQQTAAPLAGELGKQTEVLQGIQEIDAGWYNNQPMSTGFAPYMAAMKDWLNGDRQDAVPGAGNGKEFNDRFTAAVRKIYDSGHTKPLVFSHSLAIEVWTLMNTINGKDSLLTSHPLPNVGRVVITGNPTDGWTLVDWDGVRNFS
jgi:broad specificity phosphatase PhoE